jgi:hypothetical protein
MVLYGPPSIDDLCPECLRPLSKSVLCECAKGHEKSFTRLPWEGHGQGCSAGIPPAQQQAPKRVCRIDGEPMRLVD